jgi:uncharacterized protein
MPDNYFIPYGFSLMAKPLGPICNLNCTYCYYLEKQKLYPATSKFKMSDRLLEKFISEYIATIQAPVVSFAWQGGEPSLAGLEFFRKVIQFQKKYAGRKKVENVFQTNGTNMNEEWCHFFRDNNFLIGLSIDGPEEIHNCFRKYKTGNPSFGDVMKGLNLLVKYNIPFNTLTVVQKHNSQYPLDVYHFLKSIGSNYLQFIPVVERIAKDPINGNSFLVSPGYNGEAMVTDWSVLPADYGNFLIGIFDQWVRNDVGSVFIQQFDAALANWVGVHPGVCVYNDRCGDALILEHNGDVYSCDHFVFAEYLLGNLNCDPLIGMVTSEKQKKFGASKTNGLPSYCLNCEYRFACHGECPKYRFCFTPDGEYGLSYLCPSYKMFFRHIHPYMQYMDDKIKAKQSPSDVMEWAKNKKAR